MRGVHSGYRVSLALAVLLSAHGTSARADVEQLNPKASDRLLVIAPHPDDESLAAGGLMQRVLASGGSVRIVLFTAGDGYVEAVVHETGSPQPRSTEYITYGERRLKEMRAAVRVLGGGRIRLQVLGFPDGGLEALLQAHWWRSRPERSQTTLATDPPYDEALEPDVPYDGEDLRRELVTILRESRPTMIVLPDPLDRHPDHRAAGLFILLALDDWLHQGGKPAPKPPLLLSYLVHWPDWPRADAGAPFELPADLRSPTANTAVLGLTDYEVGVKRAALAKHSSQMMELPNLLNLFVRDREVFSVLPPAEIGNVGDLIEAHVPAHPRPARATERARSNSPPPTPAPGKRLHDGEQR